MLSWRSLLTAGFGGVLMLGAVAVLAQQVPARKPTPGDAFTAKVKPFLEKNCYMCHGSSLQSGGLNLESYTSAAAAMADREHWTHLLDKLQTGQMPPAGIPQPLAAEKKAVIDWVSAELARTAPKASAGRVT